jgi:hypothetical protein
MIPTGTYMEHSKSQAAELVARAVAIVFGSQCTMERSGIPCGHGPRWE